MMSFVWNWDSLFTNTLPGIFQIDNYEIKPGKKLKVNVSVANLRLFVGNIPKSKSKEEIHEEFSKQTGNGLLLF